MNGVTTLTERSVAICIPTYNQSQYLQEAVKSACLQSYTNVEVWVSDDASTDDTPAVMAELCKEFTIHYCRQEQNKGIAENSSWLLSQPDTDFVVRLDSDDVLTPDYVQTLVEALQQYPEAGYAHTAVQEIDIQGTPTCIRRVARTTGYQPADAALRAAVYGYRTSANILMFNARALRELDYYRGRPEYTEDYDLAVRMADAGYGNVYVDRVLASYRVWADDANKRFKRKNIQLKGYIRIFEESLLPAFTRRNWDTTPITRQRQQLAKRHASYCYSPLFSEAERAELIALLIRLGDSKALRWRMRMLQHGMGFVFDWQNAFVWKIKVIAKTVLSMTRSWSHRQTSQ